MKTFILPETIRNGILGYMVNSIPRVTGGQFVELWDALQRLEEEKKEKDQIERER